MRIKAKKTLRWLRPVKPKPKQKALAQPPGSLVHKGQQKVEKVEIELTEYNLDSVDFHELDDIPESDRLADSSMVNWLEIAGLHDTKKLAKLGETFGISNMILEDILNTSSRPKIEMRDEDIFIVLKMVTIDPKTQVIEMQHDAPLRLPDNRLLTFLEGPSPALDPVVERIRTGIGGRIRKYGADYLLWALVDAIVDHYLYVIDRLDEIIVEMDDRLQIDASEVEASELYSLKRDIGQLYRAIRPVGEITHALTKPESGLVKDTSRQFFDDLNDHGTQVLESTEDLRESSSALRDFYLSAVSNRMNEVMKVLTCFSTIFLPLTFLAGIYGMNFEYIPELQFRWGYPALWVLFIVAAGAMIVLFKKKKWL